MKTLYLDLISGLSGDMALGALLDLGVPFAALEGALAKVNFGGYHLHVSQQTRQGIAGTKFDVHLECDHSHSHSEPHEHDHPHYPHHHHHPPHEPEPTGKSVVHIPRAHGSGEAHDGGHSHAESRDFTAIRDLLAGSELSDWVKDRALRIFERIARAEGKIHGRPPETVHFHEVGAVDSLVDIVGTCVALELLGRPRVLASPVVDGTGWVDCAHGRFPVPAPATLEILGARGVGVSQCDEPQELVTPTGAALLAELVEEFGPLQDLVPERIGYGLGSRDAVTRPNVLRAILGETAAAGVAAHDWESDTVAVLESNLDDLNPEVLGEFVERALSAGALDVFYTPVQMKKSRPGWLLTLLCPSAAADRFAELVLSETSAFGVRRTLAERRKLRREFRTVTTPFGPITVKVGLLDGKAVQMAPEFESCQRAATEAGVPLKEAYVAALRA